MAGGGDDAEAEALQVVVGTRELGELVLAAVAGAGVDVADCEAATAARLGQVDRPAEAAEVAEQGEHQRSTQA